MEIYGYMRISTDKQDEQSQRAQLEKWSQETGSNISMIYADHASGATPWQKRQLRDIINRATPGSTIVVSEISRIARSTIGVLTFLQATTEKGLNVIAIRSGLKIDESMQSKITVTIFALAAEIERDLLRERTKAALDARRAKGLPMGRPVGSGGKSILDGRDAEIDKCLTARVAKRAIARIMKCSPQTLYAFLKKRETKTTTGEATP